MQPRIAQIDFDTCVARIVMEPSGADDFAERTCDLVLLLRSCGVEQVDVHLDPRVSAAEAGALRAAVRGLGVRLHAGRPPESCEVPGNRAFQRFLPPGATGGQLAAYEASFDTLEDLVQRSTTLVALVQVGCAIDSILAGRLRFAVHELAANTADHGLFDAAVPRIELTVAVTPSTVLLSYRDNARPFATTSPPDIDVALKIARRERRGLGLFMLNRMARQLRYRRNGDWNETTVLFVEAAGSATQPARSSVMEGLKLEQTPCRLPNTVVLKPVGSIDSTTVSAMDAKLDAVSSQKDVRVVVDMSAVTFVSSAGVGAFLGSVSQLRANGGDLVFMSMPPAVLEVFEIINLSAYFKMVGSLEELETVSRS